MNVEPRNRTPLLLWLALAAVLLSSWSHTARAFGGLEPGGPAAWLTYLSPAVGPLAALAVDLGAGALAWAVGARARQGRGAPDLWAGVVAFAALGAFANVDAALAVLGDGRQPGDVWAGLAAYDRLRVGALAAALPMLSVYLARVIETAAHDADGPAQMGAHQVADKPGSERPVSMPTGAHTAPAAPARGAAPADGQRAPAAAHLAAPSPSVGADARAPTARPSEPPIAPAAYQPCNGSVSVPADDSRPTLAPLLPHPRPAVAAPTMRRGARRKAGPADLVAAALEAPDASLSDLARTLRTPRQTVSRWAASLDDAGHLTRGAGGRWQAGEGGAA